MSKIKKVNLEDMYNQPRMTQVRESDINFIVQKALMDFNKLMSNNKIETITLKKISKTKYKTVIGSISTRACIAHVRTLNKKKDQYMFIDLNLATHLIEMQFGNRKFKVEDVNLINLTTIEEKALNNILKKFYEYLRIYSNYPESIDVEYHNKPDLLPLDLMENIYIVEMTWFSKAFNLIIKR